MPELAEAARLRILYAGTYTGIISDFTLDLNGGCRQSFSERCHQGAVKALHSRQGLLASGGSDGVINLFDLTRNEAVDSLVLGDTRGLVALNFFTDDSKKVSKRPKYLFSCSTDGIASVWETSQWSEIHSHKFKQRNPDNKIKKASKDICSAAASPTLPNTIATAYLDGSVFIWNLETKLPAAVARRPDSKNAKSTQPVTHLCWTEDGTKLILLTPHVVTVIDLESGEGVEINLPKTTKQQDKFCKVSSFGDVVVLASLKGVMKLYKLDAFTEKRENDEEAQVFDVEPWVELNIPETKGDLCWISTLSLPQQQEAEASKDAKESEKKKRKVANAPNHLLASCDSTGKIAIWTVDIHNEDNIDLLHNLDTGLQDITRIVLSAV